MSKYALLWEYVKSSGKADLTLTFEVVENILSFPIDHSFLRYKKELEEYGYRVEKISMKEQFVKFTKID